MKVNKNKYINITMAKHRAEPGPDFPTATNGMTFYDSDSYAHSLATHDLLTNDIYKGLSQEDQLEYHKQKVDQRNELIGMIRSMPGYKQEIAERQAALAMTADQILEMQEARAQYEMDRLHRQRRDLGRTALGLNGTNPRPRI